MSALARVDSRKVVLQPYKCERATNIGTEVMTVSATHSVPAIFESNFGLYEVRPGSQSQHWYPPLHPIYFPISHIAHFVLLI